MLAGDWEFVQLLLASVLSAFLYTEVKQNSLKLDTAIRVH